MPGLNADSEAGRLPAWTAADSAFAACASAVAATRSAFAAAPCALADALLRRAFRLLQALFQRFDALFVLPLHLLELLAQFPDFRLGRRACRLRQRQCRGQSPHHGCLLVHVSIPFAIRPERAISPLAVQRGRV